MQDRPLFSITQVIDDSTGIWAGDICEYGIPVGNITSFLRTHGERGMQEIEVMTLHVLRHIRENYLPKEPMNLASERVLDKEK